MVMQENAEPEASQVALIILNAAKNLEVGKLKLAAFLKGSKAKNMRQIAYQAPYGGLFWYAVATIIKFIDQLEAMSLLQRKVIAGYPYPYTVIGLTEAGKLALEEKRHISLQVIKEVEPITVGNSEKATYELIKLGKTITEIAKERSLALSTIYTHIFRLIVWGYLASSDVIQAEVAEKVKAAAGKLQNPTVKQVKELLPDISYEEIRCVLADREQKK